MRLHVDDLQIVSLVWKERDGCLDRSPALFVLTIHLLSESQENFGCLGAQVSCCFHGQPTLDIGRHRDLKLLFFLGHGPQRGL